MLCLALPFRLRFSRAITWLVFCALLAPAVTAKTEEFWQNRGGVVTRSNVILERPNLKATEAMPLGAAVWAEDGLTVQLNRRDTLPLRLSPGQITLPALKSINEAADYSGQLNLYDGEFTAQGGGASLRVYVDDRIDALVIEVAGLDPSAEQTARLHLWAPRKPLAMVSNRTGLLAEGWIDDKEAGATKEHFGSLAAITAEAQDVTAEVTDPLTVELRFHPQTNGSFRILVAAPAWNGMGDAAATANQALTETAGLGADEHQQSWHKFWQHADLMRLSSANQEAEYFENLRALYLFTAAAEGRDRYPGSQAGIGDLFSSFKDDHNWGPSAYWHWNIRMQVSANLGAGLSDLNAPYFRLYRENLENLKVWTAKHMPQREGICIPETMRFNGQGWENESWLPKPGLNCGMDSEPYYNARTISTGAEVALWVLDQYEYTGDMEFLRQNYPVVREAVRFLLSYGKQDEAGVFHTEPSNSHESQWDVKDPVTDVAAMHALFPRFVQTATLLKTDGELAQKVGALKLSELPLVSLRAPTLLLPANQMAEDAVIAQSAIPQAPIHNVENNALEPVWPYTLIGDDGPLHALGVRTFEHRPSKNEADWSYDPVQAARLGLADEMRASLLALTKRYQIYPNGMATLTGGSEFYVEQSAILTDALGKALADDYDGLIRIAPAWPASWDADGTVSLRHRNRVTVHMRSGLVAGIELEAGSNGRLKLRNPWPAEAVKLLGMGHEVTLAPSSELEFSVEAGGNYRLLPASKSALHFPPATGEPADRARKLAGRTIGLPR